MRVGGRNVHRCNCIKLSICLVYQELPMMQNKTKSFGTLPHDTFMQNTITKHIWKLKIRQPFLLLLVGNSISLMNIENEIFSLGIYQPIFITKYVCLFVPSNTSVFLNVKSMHFICAFGFVLQRILLVWRPSLTENRNYINANAEQCSCLTLYKQV